MPALVDKYGNPLTADPAAAPPVPPEDQKPDPHARQPMPAYAGIQLVMPSGSSFAVVHDGGGFIQDSDSAEGQLCSGR